VARRIRIPGLADLTFVDHPNEIRALVEAPELDRRFEARGPLVNRLIAGRIRRWFTVDNAPLPALAPREDPVRAGRQQSLCAELEPGPGKALWTEAQIERLASYVRGGLTAEEMGVTVQEVVGQRFDPGYVADRASWAAARMIDNLRDSFASPRHLWWILTGRLRRARRLLLERAGHDRHAMHGTSIGVHGIVDALERMRALRAQPGGDLLNENVALSRCLHPPRRVPRTVGGPLATPATAAPLRPGSMVMLNLERASPRAPDPEMIFMHGHWAFCPVEAFIPALLRAVWRKAVRSSPT
jgi:hypothetical protein